MKEKMQESMERKDCRYCMQGERTREREIEKARYRNTENT